MPKDYDEKVIEAINDLKKAKKYLCNIKDNYSDSNLLNLYLPSAEALVKQYSKRLETLLSEIVVSEGKHNVDVWISIEGNNFRHGKAPINIIGPLLQKINTANRHAVQLILQKNNNYPTDPESIPIPSFDLVTTKAGSFKLGLKIADIEQDDSQQELFQEDPWIIIKKYNESRNLSIEGLNLLLTTIASVQKPNLLEDLRRIYEEKSVIKLIHYAKELTPSSRAPIDNITFECSFFKEPNRIITADKQTRRVLNYQAKSLKKDSIFVKGTGVIRAIDLDNKTIHARPFSYGKKNIEDLACIFNPNLSHDTIVESIDKVVQINGFLVFDKNNVPTQLEVEDINIDNNEDSDSDTNEEDI
jgi:hypothetical protein